MFDYQRVTRVELLEQSSAVEIPGFDASNKNGDVIRKDIRF